MIHDLITLIFPRNCVHCHRPLITQENHLCISCKLDLPITQDHEIQENDLFRKFAFLPAIKSAQAYLYFHHGGVAQKLLHHLKYRGKEEIGYQLGLWYSDSLKHLDIDFILPVPLHPKKQKKRGYNQSLSIAEGIGGELGLEIRTDIVQRVKSTASQTKKSKVERWKAIENVYSSAHSDVSGKSVLVVDDVVTTGATVGMLCDRLVDQGVAGIHIASLARGK